MSDIELMRQALEALDGYARNCRCEGGGAPCDAAEALRARLAQPEPEREQSYKDNPCIEDDGCPTEKAVLQRFWRKHQQPEPEPVAWHEPGAYSNVTVYKQWAEENGWLPLYAAPPQRE